MYLLRPLGIRSQIKLGLDRIRACLSYLGNPHNKFKSVLIGGTNGKGSVTFYLSNLASRYTNYKVGRYTSPHLVSWNERFVINEKIVDDLLLKELSKEVIEKIDEFEINTSQTLTEFEIYTIIAFCLFAKEKVDLAFLEVGLGGRLDATNVVASENVLCSVITNVSYDHMDFLGSTIKQISFEKAGIIKENNLIVTACENDALNVIKNKACELNSKLVKTKVTELDFYINKNIEVALKVWELTNGGSTNLAEAGTFLRSLHFPGRFQYFQNEKILLDGAHNPHAALELRKLMDHNFKDKKILYILGMLNKDYVSFVRNLIPAGSHVICTEPRSERATKKEKLLECIIANGSQPVLSQSLEEAIKIARSMEHDVIIVTGSLYLVGEALQILEINSN